MPALSFLDPYKHWTYRLKKYGAKQYALPEATNKNIKNNEHENRDYGRIVSHMVTDKKTSSTFVR